VSAEPKPVLQSRITAFKTFLLSRPEQHIAVVGHSMFFKHFTGQSKMNNCEVRRVTLAVDGTVTALK
jgi:hypothetical protein